MCVCEHTWLCDVSRQSILGESSTVVLTDVGQLDASHKVISREFMECSVGEKILFEYLIHDIDVWLTLQCIVKKKARDLAQNSD